MATQISELKKRRGIAKGCITKLTSNLGDVVSSATEAAVIKARIASINKHLAAYEQHSNDLYGLINDTDEVENMAMADADYCDGIRVIIAQLEAVISSASSSANAGTAPQSNVKLPTLQLPKFTGDPKDWVSFWDLYKCAVHTNITLTDTQKFSYLKGQLEGEAARLLDGFELIDSSYKTAVELLKETYGRKDRIKTSLVLSLCSLPAPSYDLDSLKSFYAHFESTIRSIQSMNISIEEVLAIILFNKVPSPMCENIKRAMKDPLDLKEFLKIFKEELFNLEGAYGKNFHDERTHISTSTFSTASTNSSGRVGNAGSKTIGNNEVNKSATAGTKKRKFACYLCGGKKHPWFRCDRYNNNQARINRARELKLCLGCLSPDHGKKGCINQGVSACTNCGKKHFRLLCPKSPVQVQANANTADNSEVDTGSATAMSISTPKDTVVLPTLLLPVLNKAGNGCTIRCLLDQCSQRTFIRRETLSYVKHMRLGTEKLQLEGFTGIKNQQNYDVVSLQYKDKAKFAVLQAVVVDKLPTYTNGDGMQEVISKLQSSGYRLADPQLTSNLPIEVLIGADQYYNFVQPGYKREEGLVLLPTPYGFALSGSCFINRPGTQVEVVTVLKVAVSSVQEQIYGKLDMTDKYTYNEADVCKLWELDNIGIAAHELDEDSKKTLKLYEEAVTFIPERGQYEVGLPWRPNKHELPTNYGLALGRLRHLQHKFVAQPEYCAQYTAVIQDQLNRQFIEPVKGEVLGDSPIHYLPHHGVKRNSTTTPVRIVFDCSAKISSNSRSLNDCLFTGPSLVPELAGVMLRFRCGQYGFLSDIEKAFLMLSLREEDRDSTRFLWPSDPMNINSDLIEYRFRVVLFGATCSPFLLNATILKHLSTINDQALVNKIKEGLYIDNLQCITDTEQELINNYNLYNNIFSQASLHLRQYVTNSPQLRAIIEQDGVAANSQAEHNYLGMKWLVNDDVLTFGRKILSSAVPTKRNCLKIISQLFDPLGVLLPVTIRSRIFIQILWRAKVEWDEPIPSELISNWQSLTDDLIKCQEVTVPRRIVQGVEVTIHAFSDASNSAYGAAVYLSDGTMSALACAKARVAPVKTVTVPKLELTAVLIAARVTKFVIDSLSSSYSIKEVYLWSDSKIALSWIRSCKVLPVYVTNRVNEIHAILPNARFRYVDTRHNPGDLITRGITTDQLNDSLLWWQGPHWLNEPRDWPDDCAPELETSPAAVVAVASDSKLVIPWDRYSGFAQMVRVLAWVLRYIKNLRCKVEGTEIDCAPIKSKELRLAECKLISIVQRESYPIEWDKLSSVHRVRHTGLTKQLGLYIDGDLIKCRGRLQYAQVRDDTKYPILMPPKHPVTLLLVRKAHKECCHYGLGHVVVYLRQKWWIPRIRQVVKSVLKDCVTCKKLQGRPYSQMDAPPLPSLRVVQQDPFAVTGIDYTGSLNIRDRVHSKAYIILMTCAITRAIHMEIVTNLSCDSFLQAFRRFVSRQGFPQLILSDNATTFVSASKYLTDPSLTSYMSGHGCTWKFIPARAPWFGAIWERMIGIVKNGLRKVLGKALVTLEELSTVLCEVEACVNDRPLTYVSGDLDDLIPITPSHLVRGRRLTQFPKDRGYDNEDEDPSYLSNEAVTARYHYMDKLVRDLWNRWHSEYLVALRERHTCNVRSKGNVFPRVGDVVLIHDEGPRQSWKLGCITRLFTSGDENTRVAQIKMGTGMTTRPVVRLYPLELNVEEGEPNVLVPETTDASPSSPAAPPVASSGPPSRTTRRAAMQSAELWRARLATGQL